MAGEVDPTEVDGLLPHLRQAADYLLPMARVTKKKKLKEYWHPQYFVIDVDVEVYTYLVQHIVHATLNQLYD